MKRKIPIGNTIKKSQVTSKIQAKLGPKSLHNSLNYACKTYNMYKVSG